MQLNTDHTKACLLKDFFWISFKMLALFVSECAGEFLMTLLLQLAVVEVHQELPLLTT